MNELPKRSDDIYKEIENFEDYEYTNCIAYEMAIRNEELNELIKEVNKMRPLLLDKDISEKIEKFGFDGGCFSNLFWSFDTESKDNKIINKRYVRDLIEGKKKILTYYHKKKMIYKTNWVIKDRKKVTVKYDELKLTTKLNNSDITLEKLLEISTFDKLSEYAILLKNDARKVTPINLLNDLELENFDLKFLKTLTKDDFENYASATELKMSRDKLVFKENNMTELTLNFNLPKDELIAYISKIKDEYDKDNSIIKTPFELLGEDLDKADEIKSKALPKDKIKRKKALADAFYIYDVWKILELKYAEKTADLKIELEKEIKAIKQNMNYDKYEKKSLIADIKDNYEIDLNQYSKPSLKTEIANLLDTSIDNVEKLHALMVKYIDNLKYKELITGVSN